MTPRALSIALGIAITAAALWWLITPEVARELKIVLASADWRLLAAAVALGAAVQWLRAWRFAILTSGALELPEWKLVGIAFQLNLFNFVLPFRLGELSYPMMMRRAYGQPLVRAGGVLLLARLFDLCIVGAILAFMVAVLGLAGTGLASFGVWLLVAALAAAPFVLALATGFVQLLVASLPKKGFLAKMAGAPASSSEQRFAQFAAVLLSFAIWLVFGALAMIAASALVEMPLAVAMLGASASNLAFALPINGIGGLGPAQAAWAVAVNQAGISWEDAVISAFALYAVTLASALLFGGIATATAGETSPARSPILNGREET